MAQLRSFSSSDRSGSSLGYRDGVAHVDHEGLDGFSDERLLLLLATKGRSMIRFFDPIRHP
jgi:hypothetical protein